jgi:hypothetical protein
MRKVKLNTVTPPEQAQKSVKIKSCNIKPSWPICPLLATSRGATIVRCIMHFHLLPLPSPCRRAYAEQFHFASSSFFLKVKQSHYTPWRRLGGEEILLLLILDLGTRWGWVVSAPPLPCFTPGERTPRYPLDRRLGGPQSRSGYRGYRKNPLSPPGIEPRSPGRPSRSQTLYWLRYPAHL